MKLSIAQRVSLAFGVMLFLFFMTSVVAYVLATRVEDSAKRLSLVEQAREGAVLETQAAVAEATRQIIRIATGVIAEPQDDRNWQHLLDGADTDLAGVLAVPRHAALHRRAVQLIGGLRQLGLSAIATADNEQQALAAAQRQLAVLTDHIDGQIGRYRQASVRGVSDRREAAFALTFAAKSVTATLTFNRLSRQADIKGATGAAQAAFDQLSALMTSSTEPLERAWFDALRARMADWQTSVRGTVASADEKHAMLRRLAALHASTETLLVSDILQPVRMAKARALGEVDTATDLAIIYLGLMTGFGGIVGAGAALVLIRGIVRPLTELKEGADAIGRGLLDHRIEIVADDEIGELAMSFNRMAEKRQSSEDDLRKLAHHDPLTGLPNRTLFQDRLLEALENARRVNRSVAVHFLDLDHFKDVNDTLGHPTGDALLRQVAKRLQKALRLSDTVARLGGDEFAIIQTNLETDLGIPVVAQRLIDSIAAPFELEGERVYTGTSVGITVYPRDDTEPDKLVKNADMALYRAKQEGRGKFEFYDPEMNAAVLQRKALEADLREALGSDQLFLQYQPKVDVASGEVVGAEALVRWQHPERGLVSPGDFIPVAEQSGLITRLTDFVLREACRQAKAWQEAGLPPVRVAVNLSAVDFRRKDLIPLVTRTLDDTRLDPAALELEITEGMVMHGHDWVVSTLHELKDLGVQLAIDDFGTGYSSMNYLKQFPVNSLKIDQSFVRDIMSNRKDASITKAIIKIGHALDLKVVAEGVEMNEQLEFLRLRACDEAQGYWISRPLGADAFTDFMRADTAKPAASSGA